MKSSSNENPQHEDPAVHVEDLDLPKSDEEGVSGGALRRPYQRTADPDEGGE